jgi:selenocysteine-specific elongation factor
MISRNSLLTTVLLALILGGSEAFTTQSIISRSALANSAAANDRDGSTTTTTVLHQFGKKKAPVEDLSYIETRDLTREEMLNINKRNEEVMNRELQAMTGISVLFSIPILYLCWVAFFSE